MSVIAGAIHTFVTENRSRRAKQLLFYRQHRPFARFHSARNFKNAILIFIEQLMRALTDAMIIN